jgi:hypothetical protein
MSTIPPNNNTGLYNTTGPVIPVDNNILANNISATGNVTVNGYITSNGSITTNSNFVGPLVGNVTAPGNISAQYFIGNGSQLTGITATSSYGNANVANFMANYGANTVSTTGNIAGGYILGNGSQLTGLPSTYTDSNVNTHLANFGSNVISTTGNITGGYFIGNGSQLTGLPASYGNANVAAYLPTYTGNLNPNTVSATGNITGLNLKTSGALGNIVGANYVQAGYFVGDGSLLTNLPAGNAVIAGNLAGDLQGNGFGANAFSYVSAVGNVTGGNINTAGGVYVTGVVSAVGNVRGGNINTVGQVTATGNITGAYFFGNGSQLTGLPATYGNSNVVTLLSAFGSNTISTSGNITGGYILGNGSQLTGLPATYSNANVTTLLASFGSNTISTTGNITAGNFIGNGRQLTGIVSSYGDSNVTNLLSGGTYTGDIQALTGVVTASAINSTGALSASSYVQAANGVYSIGTFGGTYSDGIVVDYVTGNGRISMGGGDGLKIYNGGPGSTQLVGISSAGALSTVGNITAPYYFGNGSQLTGITATASAGGANTQIQYNNAGSFAGNTAMTFNNTTGNIGLQNLIISPIANAVYMYNTVATDVSTYNAAGTPILGRTIYGTPFAGNLVPGTQDLSNALKSSKFVVTDTLNYGTNGASYSTLASQSYITLTSNISNAATNFNGFKSTVAIGGGSAANTISTTSATGGIIGQNLLTTIGSGGTTYSAIGNTALSHTIGSRSQVATNPGSNVGNIIVHNIATNLNAATSGVVGNTVIGLGLNFGGNGLIGNSVAGTGNLYAIYLANSTATYGLSSSSTMRGVANYYFLKNDDPLALCSPGSFKTYQNVRYLTPTSGSFAIDKNNGQSQTCQLTGDVTITGFNNFVSSTSTGSGFYFYQTDTVTLMFQQGATGANITLPTGANYKYANGVSTLGNTANTYQTVTITANDATGNSSATGTVQYLITVSPVFS